MARRARQRDAWAWALIACGGGGIACQFLQVVDTKPTLLYFTVWSVALGVASAGALLAWPRSLLVARVLEISCVSMLLCGITYFLVILPTVGLHRSDGPLVWLANTLMHAVAPVCAVMLARCVGTGGRPGQREMLLAYVFPATYLVVVLVLRILWGIPPAYDFLRPSVVGTAVTVIACLAMLALVGVLRLLLTRVVYGRKPGATSRDAEVGTHDRATSS